jgi:transposase
MSNAEQRYVIKFLQKEGGQADVIQERVVNVYGTDALSKPTIYRWLREFTCGRETVEDLPRLGRPPLDHIDSEILEELSKNPFYSCRSLAEALNVTVSTVWTRLHESLGFTSICLRCVPHTLTDDLRRRRVDVAKELRGTLQSEASNNFDRIVTGDKSWLYLSYLPKAMWAVSQDDLSINERRTVAA